MVEFVFGDLTFLDVIMASLTAIIGGIILAIAYIMASKGIPNWKPRKLVHISMGTIIGFTAMRYSNLSGPALAAGVFITILVYAWAHKPDLISELLIAGSREEETRLNTFASGFMGMISFMIPFLIFMVQPSIFLASILAVAWADAAGEVFGRSFGGTITNKRFRKKSIEGSIGVFIFSILAILISLTYYWGDVCPLCVFPEIVLIALVIVSTELFSTGWTDNFLIPLTTAILMWILIFPTMPLFVF